MERMRCVYESAVDRRDLHKVDRRQRQVCIHGRSMWRPVARVAIPCAIYFGKCLCNVIGLSPIHLSEPTRLRRSSYAALCSKT